MKCSENTALTISSAIYDIASGVAKPLSLAFIISSRINNSILGVEYKDLSLNISRIKLIEFFIKVGINVLPSAAGSS